MCEYVNDVVCFRSNKWIRVSARNFSRCLLFAVRNLKMGMSQMSCTRVITVAVNRPVTPRAPRAQHSSGRRESHALILLGGGTKMQRASDRLRKWGGEKKEDIANFRDINSLRNAPRPAREQDDSRQLTTELTTQRTLRPRLLIAPRNPLISLSSKAFPSN